MKRQRLDDEEEAKGQVNDKPAAPTIATQNASSVKQQNIPKPHPSHHHRAPTSHNSIIPDSLNFPSIFKHDSNYDDICLEVTNLINKHLNGPNGQYLELEAKLGVFVDKQSGHRVSLPIKSETMLVQDGSYRFEANMPMGLHAHFNKMLNEMASHGLLIHTHTVNVDEHYEGGGAKVRVSKNKKTNQVLPNGIVNKVRIADIDIFMPLYPLDYRISLNAEIPTDPPDSNRIPHLKREKDRVCYTQDVVQVDLTQVKSEHKATLHEVEVEFRDMNLLRVEKTKWDRKEHNKFKFYINVLLNSVRSLSRRAPKR